MSLGGAPAEGDMPRSCDVTYSNSQHHCPVQVTSEDPRVSLHEDLIFSDPVLQRVFFDARRFAPTPGKEADVYQLLSRIAEREVAFHKARTIEGLERLTLGEMIRVKYRPTVGDEADDDKPCPKFRYIRRAGMREMYFQVRALCDGYYFDQLTLAGDGCQHVLMFAHEKFDPVFRPQYSARFHLWQKYARRRPVSQPGCRWF